MSSSIWFFSLVFFAAAEKSKSRNWTTAFVLFNGRHICAALGSAFLFGLNFLDFSFCLRGRFFFVVVVVVSKSSERGCFSVLCFHLLDPELKRTSPALLERRRNRQSTAPNTKNKI